MLTPAGNWSSYPPHKHDEDRPGETELEEIYYVRGRPRGGMAATSGCTAPDRPIDVLAEVRTGDIVLIPHGWHGPSMAAPGYDLYYLNVMAGPGAERAWRICDDPAHGWVRGDLGRAGDRPAAALRDRAARAERAARRPSGRHGMTGTVRLTVAQAVVRFLAAQRTERDGVTQRLFAGCFGIFGHGNVAGLGQALLQAELLTPARCRTHQGRNEQAMVHAPSATPGCATGCRPAPAPPRSARARPTCSPAPRWPPSTGCRCCCCPATSSPPGCPRRCCRSWRQPCRYDVSVNDAFRPLSRFFDRVWRPEQLPAALLGAMRVLTDPAETGAATIALPQDVQAEAYDWPVELFAERVWHVARPVPEPAALERAAAVIRSARGGR